MARLISTIVVLGLLGGTAAAFAITEGLKLERSPITGTRITSTFSPGCKCSTALAHIDFRLRKNDSVTATVLRADGKRVQTIASSLDAPRGFLRLRWDGRDELGMLAPPGDYKVRIHLARRHQTINLPNTIIIDKTPPRITVTRVRPPVFSPNHDGRKDHVAIRFAVSETARPLLLVNGRRALRGRLTHVSGTLYWSGRIDGHRLPTGRYALTLRAQDVAGNRSPPSRAHVVEINYVSADLVENAHLRAGRLFFIRVSSDARRVAWRLDGENGFVKPGKVHLRAPKRPGRYRLVFSVGGHQVSAHVIVRKR